jgi:transcriptional regulator with XRE-family HTH domain
MTQQELADRIGVTRQTVNAIELGARRRSRWRSNRGRIRCRADEVFAYGAGENVKEGERDESP